ncbi:MAG: OmpA family protein [Clostridia bacterium]|nr:OmpA family protein [Clostridia bacterium]
MKKLLALLMAAALILMPAFAFASSDDENKGTQVTNTGGISLGTIGGFKGSHEVTNTEVTNTGGIDLGTIGAREEKTVESAEVTNTGGINLGTIGGYTGSHEVESTEVTNTGGIDLGTIGGYTGSHEVESTEVTNTGGIDLGTIAPREDEAIENKQVTAVEIDLGTVKERHDKEIENVSVVNNGEINLSLLSYAAKEITQSNVVPVGDINLAIAQFNAPDIRGQIPVEVEPFYANLFTFAGEAGRAQMVAMTDVSLAGFVRRQYEIIGALVTAFEQAGIPVEVDELSGMVRIDAALLYDTNEYQVTSQGKATLSEVFRIYCAVLAQEEYRDEIAHVIIAGHTDNAGTYEYNVGLSQRRAEAAKEFCLSPECGVEDLDWLAPRLEAQGYSYDRLIFNADGTVNMDASRRVEIGFTLKMD